MLLPINEFGFLPVPPVVHELRLADLPGAFGAGSRRQELWQGFLSFTDFLVTNTPFRELYLDGAFISAADTPDFVEVGIELAKVDREILSRLKVPFLEEWSVRVRYYSPRRPEGFNFHEEFQRPDPDLRASSLPAGTRKGYIRVRL